MQAHSIKLSNGRSNFTGKMVVSENALYFLCVSKGNALVESAGIALSGPIGAVVLKSLAGKENYGQLAEGVTENDLVDIAKQLPDSIVFETKKIEKIHNGFLMKMIKWDNKKIGVVSFSKELRAELAPWAAKHNIQSKGL